MWQMERENGRKSSRDTTHSDLEEHVLVNTSFAFGASLTQISHWANIIKSHQFL